MLDYSAYISASFAGLLLFCIGILGLSGMPVALNPAITVLLEPLGWAHVYDTAYYLAFVFLGLWLVLCVYTRIAALLALALVMMKFVMFH
ncbi:MULTISPECIES: hypothetical protein [unclassified Yoonia]|uniref:hypothetical protein n=1 Tax=unclassified Yoonia TaxID=2629118 RepID=UPI002AFE8A46|nr:MULTISPECIES: hypothetical protein [unclassified Yoonia]